MQAMKEVPLSRHRWVSKTMSGHFVHGKNMVWWHYCTTSECPLCLSAVEDKEHIIRCPAPAAVTTWNTTLEALESWLTETGMDPLLTQTLIHNLQAWHSHSSPPSLQASSPSLQQEQIGWHRALDGWLPKKWWDCQDHYWKMARTHQSSKQWTSELIKKLWNIAWDMWDHWNETLYSTEATSQLICDSKVNDDIHSIYALGTQSLPRDAFAFLWLLVEEQLAKPQKGRNNGWHLSEQKWKGKPNMSMAITSQNKEGCADGWVSTGKK